MLNAFIFLVFVCGHLAYGKTLLGFTPWQIDTSEDRFDFALTHGDIISIHDPSMHVAPSSPITIGGKVPYDSFRIKRTYEESRKFLSQDPITLKWLQDLDKMLAQCQGKPIYLSEEFMKDRQLVPDSMTNFPSEFLVNGKPSFTKKEVQEALSNYALFLVSHFRPIAFSPFVELNLSYGKIDSNFKGLNASTEEWSGVLQTYDTIYKKVKNYYPSIPVFPTFLWYLMQKADGTKFGTSLVRSIHARTPIDMIGLSDYPNSHIDTYANPHLKPEDIPKDYYEKARIIIPGTVKQVVISENGWWTKDPNGLDQLAYYKFLLSEATRLNMPFVINFFGTDPISLDHTAILPWGFQSSDPSLSPRPTLEFWNQYRIQ